jgi:fermentation-respiration switch protein FrsA (DUF1100 family)
MWATEPHEGITGVTFDSDGHRLVGTLYLARGEERKPTVLLLHGCPGLEKNLAASLRLSLDQLEREFTRFLATTPEEFGAQLASVAERMDGLAAVTAIRPRPLLVVHGTWDQWVPVAQARELAARAGSPSRYIEMAGANHAFSWHRTELAGLITGWLGAAFDSEGVRA